MTKRPEHRLQCEIVNYLRANAKPHLVFSSTANGELRHPVVAKRLKDAGLLPGVSDIFIVLDHGPSCWLELKSQKGSLTWEQKGFAAKIMALGHYWGMARSLPEAVAILKTWNVLKENAEEAA